MLKKIAVAGVVSFVIFNSNSIAANLGLILNKEEATSIYTEMFSNPDLEVFENSKPLLKIGKSEMGQFISSTKGLMVYGSLNEGIEKLAKIKLKDDKYISEDDALMKISGLQIYQKNHDQGTSFPYYNPDIIKWGINNLYISPDTNIMGIKAQEIYDRSFQIFFRRHTEAYLLLNSKKKKYKKEQDAYLKEYKNPKDGGEFDAVGYLIKNYGKKLKISNNEYQNGVAAGFWIRRGIDKTDKLVWDGLAKTMNAYDKAWFAKAKKLKF